MTTGIVPGTVNTVYYRDVEHYLKCPVRYRFNTSMMLDFSPTLYRVLDEVISSYALRCMVSNNPWSLEEATSNFTSRFETYIQSAGVKHNDITSGLIDSAISKGHDLLQKYLQIHANILKEYQIITPSIPIPYSNWGTTINVHVLYSAKRKAKASVHPVEYIVLDYSSKTTNLNSYARLWASAVKLYLQEEKGITAIAITVLSVPEKRLYRLTPSQSGMASQMLSDICRTFSAGTVYPVFGNHCHSCLFRPECASSCVP